MHPGFRRIDIMVECGNQCTILPMVFVDNIPNDCVIGGIPAKILKYKNKKDIYDK